MNKDRAQAIVTINKLISEIKFESPEDEGAAEWQYHLVSVKQDLLAGALTVKEASDDLGVTL